MRSRPANISLINRRHYLPRLPLTLSSFEKNDQLTLTGHYISLPHWRQADRDPASSRRIPCFHAAWHVFVLVGSIARYFAILFYIVPRA